MDKTELNSKVKDLRELRRMSEEIAAEIEAITDTIKDVYKRQLIGNAEASVLSKTTNNSSSVARVVASSIRGFNLPSLSTSISVTRVLMWFFFIRIPLVSAHPPACLLYTSRCV